MPRLLFLGRWVVPSSATRGVAGTAWPIRIAGIRVGAICHDGFLSCEELSWASCWTYTMLSPYFRLAVPLHGKPAPYPDGSQSTYFRYDCWRISDPTVPQVEVLRVLGPYGRMLRLEPAISMAPDPEFLVRLFTGHASHQAYIRHEAGSLYKNLENLARGRHKVSRTTMQALASRLGLTMEYLEKLAGSALDGPLIPDILTLFQMVEGFPMRVASGALNRVVSCPCCGENLLDDVDAWWSKSPWDGSGGIPFCRAPVERCFWRESN